MKILATGFEPFAGASLNPSEKVLPLLTVPQGCELTTVILPVSFSRAAHVLDQAIEKFSPDVVVALGQAEGRSEISIERFAINLADVSIADNDGQVVSDRLIATDGPTAYPTSLPAQEMVAAAKGAGSPAGLSLSAGSFLCNFVFYHLAHTFRGRSGFIHLPLIPEQAPEFSGKPAVELEVLARGLSAALAALTTK